ncbi:inverse autotransporter beta domain-containing protein [Salmonella enterica]
MSCHKKDYQLPRFRYSALARCVAWANISVQVLFPLAVTFTPAMAAHAPIASQLPLGTENTESSNTIEQNVASLASNAGTFLSGQPDSDATRNFITGMATAKANQEIQQWLGKYGTARVKLNVDKDFSLKDSSLEMLYPFYDTPTDMLFTQGAIHRTDDRTQSNIGFGWRHFSGNDWMAGVNTFIDHDLSRSHTRVGIGSEYWRDYLKLSANGYLRVSKWKNSPDVEDYQERPANGWDVRAEGYLPAYPQLGASLMYEQYYGDEVGLFGKDERQKDPHAISAGINYTPIPLLTLSAEHKQGKGGENETRFGLDVNYRIGESLAKQLDSDNVRERRVLAGSRYDLVERNNNIVLEYRKAEVIRIALPNRIEGKGGQTVSLGLVVSKATHGLKSVQWEAPSLLAAGGKITGQGNQWEIKLPTFQAGKDNRYAISAVAYDTKGNASKRAQTEVVITGAGVSTDRTTLTLGGQSSIKMLANGTEQMPLRLTLRDAEGQPIVGMKDQIKTEISFKPAGNIVTRSRSQLQAQPKIGEVREIDNGEYEAIFTTGTLSGEATIIVDVDGVRKSVIAELRATMMDVAESTLKADEHSTDVVADGLQSYTLTLTSVDTEGNPVSGEASRLRFVPQDSRGVNVGNVTEIKPGVYTATVSSTRAGKITVQAFSEQYQLGSLQETLSFVAGPVDAAHSTITLNPENPTVGGTVTASWVAKDAYDNQVSNVSPDNTELTGDAATGSSVSGWTDNGNGSWSAQISLGTTAGELIVMPKLNGQDAAAQAGKVTVGADILSPDNSQISAEVSSLKTEESTKLTLFAKDEYGNAVRGLSFSTNLTGSAAEGSTVSAWVDHGDGTYSATLTAGGKIGDLGVMPQFNGRPAVTEALQLTVMAGALSAANSTIVADNKTPTVKKSTELTFTAKDAYGNLISDMKPETLVFGGAANTGTDKPSVGEWSAKGDGTWVATLNLGSTAGQLTVMPRVNGKDAAQQPESLNVTGDSSLADVSSIEVKVDGQLADGQAANQVVLTVTDKYDNPLQNQSVELTLPEGMSSKAGNSLTTDANGKVNVELTSTVAGEREFTVSVNGHDHKATITYKADASSGQASLQVDSTGEKTANGTDFFTLTASVRDKLDNPVPDTLVTFNLPKGVKMPEGQGNHVYTDKNGNAELKVVSVTAGTYEVTASAANGQPSAPKAITFVGDKATATIADIVVVNNAAKADGKTKQTYKVTVKDANNNVLQGSDVTLTASPEGLVINSEGKATTDEKGQAVFTATTTIAGTYTLTAKVVRTDGQQSTKTAEAKFIADEINAKLTATLEDVADLVADGESTATLELSLMAGVNPVGGTFDIEVTAPQDVTESDYKISPNKSEHFVSGKRTLEFSTRKPGEYQLTISAWTYGGYEINPVTVKINAVAPETDESEEDIK